MYQTKILMLTFHRQPVTTQTWYWTTAGTRTLIPAKGSTSSPKLAAWEIWTLSFWSRTTTASWRRPKPLMDEFWTWSTTSTPLKWNTKRGNFYDSVTSFQDIIFWHSLSLKVVKSFWRLVNDHILLQGTLTSSIPDMRKVNGLIDLSNKYQGDGSNKIDAKVNLYVEIQYPASSSVRLARISIESEKREEGHWLLSADKNKF